MRTRSILVEPVHIVPLNLSLTNGDGDVCRVIALQMLHIYSERKPV